MGLVATVQLREWEFHISETGGTIYVSVPDRGGMMDSIPRVPEQLAWAESAFADIPALKQIWSTSWEVPPEALAQLRELFERNGARLTWGRY
jgi:hypothetical protein